MMKKILTATALLIAVVLCFTACKSDEAKNVNTLIGNIGTVSLDSEEAIKTAEEAYAALTDEQKAEVNKYEKLEQSRAEYEKLVEIDVVDKAIAGCKSAVEANDTAVFWTNALAADGGYKKLAEGDYDKDKYTDFLKNTFLTFGISALSAEIADESTDYSAMAAKRDMIKSALEFTGDAEGAGYEDYAALTESFTAIDKIIGDAQTAAETYYTLFMNFYNKEENVTVTEIGCKSVEVNGKVYFVFSITYKNAEDKEKTLYASSIYGAQHTVETLASSYENYFSDSPAAENYDAHINGNIVIDLAAIIGGESGSDEQTTSGDGTTAGEETTAGEATTAAEATTAGEETTAAAEATTAGEQTTVAAEETTAAAEETTVAAAETTAAAEDTTAVEAE